MTNGVNVAATPSCSVICFCNQIFLRHSDRGVARWVRQGFFGGACGGCSATSLKLRESAATLFARHCVARHGSQHVCATKTYSQDGRNSLKIKFLGRIFLGHQGPRRRDIRWPQAWDVPDKKIDQQHASITWCDLFRPNFGKITQEIISVHDVWEPWKQALLAYHVMW